MKNTLNKNRLLLLLCLCISSFPAHASKVIGNRVIDMQGNMIQLGMDGTVLKPIALAFIQPGCASSDSYTQELNTLAQEAKNAGLIFYAVAVDPNSSWQELQHFRSQKELQFPLIFDADGNLFNELKPTLAPEAFIIGKHDELLYQGRLENPLRLDNNKFKREFSAAITAVGLGKTPIAGIPVGNGCSLSGQALNSRVTYNRNIAPLIYANCAECHREKGIAPFPLLSYPQTKNFSGMIAYATKERIMPPWKAKAGSGHYLNERLLSQHQIDLLDIWASSGAKEGDSRLATPPPKLNTSEWRLGPPDIVITMPESFDIPAAGADIYRYFVVKNAIPEYLEIAATDFKPGDASVVHHSNFFVDYGKRARKMDALDPEPGFSVFGTGGFFSYWDSDASAAGLGAWAPGGTPVRYPDGIGTQLPGGADFVFEIHYHPTGKKTRDQSQFGIYLAKKPVKKAVTSLFIGTNQVDIPPGDDNYQRHFWMDVPADMTLIDIAPHMHYLGTHAKVTATLPSGEKISLMDVEWDFRWQGAYYLREPVLIPKGSRIDAYTSYDNSSNNPYNPYSPPIRATWGWGTDQEMGEIYLTILTKNQTSLKKLQRASFQSWARSSDPRLVNSQRTTASVLMQLENHSTWDTEGESLARYIVSHPDRFKQSLKLLKQNIKQANRREDDQHESQLLSLRGSLYGIASTIATGEYQQYSHAMKAHNDYEAALELGPTLWDPRYGLAIGYAGFDEKDYQDGAHYHFNILRQQQHDAKTKFNYFAKTYKEQGDLLLRTGNSELATKIWQEGNRMFPYDPYLIERLGLEKKGPPTLNREKLAP